MVARIKFGKSVRGALSYNETKVEQGVAECIGANGFLKDLSKINFYEKLEVFTGRNERNTGATTNTIHISLNFDASEIIDKDTLNLIAASYMDKIGFGDQPYLVYEHKDAAHPHVHIVSTIIQSNGDRIPTHFMGKALSEKARKDIEKEYNLVRAQGRGEVKKQKGDLLLTSTHVGDMQQISYGKNETKRSIALIVSNVMRTYRFTSLAELNAVLRLYHVAANRGSARSQMFLKSGLHYSVVNENGQPVGVPIKASSLPGKPILKTLEKKFAANQTLRAPSREPLKRIVEAALSMNSIKKSDDLVKVLQSQNIRTLWRINPQGRVYGVTFVDQDRKTVFNGSDLGKAYTANAIIERLSAKEHAVNESRYSQTSGHEGDGGTPNPKQQEQHEFSQLAFTLEQLASVQEKADFTTPENGMRLKYRKRKKKKSS